MKLMKKTKIRFEINDYDTLFDIIVDNLKIYKIRPKKISEELRVKLDKILEYEQLSMSQFRSEVSNLFNYKGSNNINYWIERGFSEQEGKKIIYERSKKGYDNSKLKNLNPKERIQLAKKANKAKQEYISKMKEENPEKLKTQFNTNIEYYLAKGMSQEDSEEALKARQSTFSKKKMIEKYGEEKGLEKLQKRNEKWILSLKENNNWNTLSKSKGRTFDQLAEKYGEEKANDIIYKRTKNSVGFRLASNESLLVFEPLIVWLETELHIDYSDIYVGKKDSREYYIRNIINGQFLYSYDFTIKSLDLIIEYNGEAFHPNPEWDKETWDYWSLPHNKEITADLKRSADINKIGKANSLGYNVLELWSSKSPEENLEIAKNFIMEYF